MVKHDISHSAFALRDARIGDTEAVLAIAREVGAAAVIVGNLIMATRRISPAGVTFEQATGALSARAYIVSTGEEVRTFHSTSTRSHVNTLAAVSQVKSEIAQELSDSLAWSIPELLAHSPQVFRIELGGVDTSELSRTVGGIEALDGVTDATVLQLPDESRAFGVIQVQTGFIRISPAVMVATIEGVLDRPLVIQRSTPHDLHLVAESVSQ